MICKSCGRANELGARFCKSCGAPLESNESMQQNNTNQSENVCQQNNQYVMPGGWLIIVCGVYSIIYTFKYQNAWNKYQQTGQI